MVVQVDEFRPPWIWPRAAYVHIPFCAHHCGYCDFAIAVGKENDIALYLEALGAELAGLGKPQLVETLFVGGGTPTHLDAGQLDTLLTLVSTWLPLFPGGEFSVEANPANLSDDKVRVLAEHGVNRLSLGVQSFDPNLLRVLERDHLPADVGPAVERVRKCIPQLSLDLIFGVPGQTVAQWQRDLQHALTFAPDHLATYGLTFEKGTPLWKQRERSQVRSLDEDTELAMYTAAMDVLAAAGFEHYEISNYALPGRRCRHNQVYWANHAHFGFGMGAARYVELERQLNTRDLHTYIRRTLAGASPVFQSEKLPPRQRALETVAVQLRRKEGIVRAAFGEQTGFALDELLGSGLVEIVDLRLLEDDGVSVCLTRAGKCVADAVVTRLMRDG